MKKKILICLACFSLFFASPAHAVEMIVNGGFESWTVSGPSGPPDDWDLSGANITAIQDGTTVYSGDYSPNITWTTTSTRYLQQTDIPVTEGETYVFSFWVFDNDPDGRARPYVRWYLADNTTYISASSGDYSVDQEGWQFLSTGAITAPPGAAWAHAEIRVYDVPVDWDGDATVYVDDASFMSSTVCTPGETQYCDTGLLGVCADGTQTCSPDGFWGECAQDVMPSEEICDDGLDNDCDGLVDLDDPDCCECTIELDASYEAGTLSLTLTIGTPLTEPGTWVNFLILICPTIQVIPLWSVQLPVICPPIEIPQIAFPLPSLGRVGFWTCLFTEEGPCAPCEIAWVDTIWSSQ